MNNRLGLFREAIKKFVRNPVKRKLYTVSIYPYPHHYINTKLYPGQVLYRETWPMPANAIYTNKVALWGFRSFWTYWFYMLFNDPSPILGHFTLPDPRQWTDEELGIPPDEAGSYEDWLKQHDTED